jgi:hypothetical protein
MVRHGASHKIKCFKVLLYTRYKAKTRFDFGKDQGLAREREKKRVTPEFGERKEEKKFYPQIQGVTLPWCPPVPHSSSLYLYARVLGRDGACLRARSRRCPRACLTLVALACALDPWRCSRALGSRVDRPRARSRWRSPAWLRSGAASARFAVVFCISQL